MKNEWFSSPLWGFFYLIIILSVSIFSFTVLVPSLGILLFNNAEDYICPPVQKFSSPLWGFFYLMSINSFCCYQTGVLVPSLGILLFNKSSRFKDYPDCRVLVPSLGILLFNEIQENFFNATKRRVLVPSLGILLFNPVLENSDKHLAILYVCD